MKLRKVVSAARYEEGIRLLEAIVSMLTKIIWVRYQDIPDTFGLRTSLTVA
jgi:hypothetical protein